MTRTFTIMTLAAAAALAGCNQSDSPVVLNDLNDDSANFVANGPIELPPAIAASKIYRCKDNSVVYIDWLADKQTANIRSDKNQPAVQVKAPAAGEPMVAEGYSLAGTAEGSSVTLTRPGTGSETCKA